MIRTFILFLIFTGYTTEVFAVKVPKLQDLLVDKIIEKFSDYFNSYQALKLNDQYLPTEIKAQICQKLEQKYKILLLKFFKKTLRSKILYNSTSWITTLAISPTAEQLLIGSASNKINFLDLLNSTDLEIDMPDSWLTSAAFTPDGKRVLLGYDQAPLRSMNLANYASKILRGHRRAVSAVTLSSDGKYALTGSDDNTARFCSLESLQCNLLDCSSQEPFEGNIRAVALSSDSSGCNGAPRPTLFALTGSTNNTIKLWDLTALESRVLGSSQIEWHSGPITSLMFSNNNKFALSASADKTARLWDLTTANPWCMIIFGGHTDVVKSAIFSPDNNQILTVSYDKTVRIWDIDTLEFITLTDHSDRVSTIVFDPKGNFFLTSSYDRTVRLWDWRPKIYRKFKFVQFITLIKYLTESHEFLKDNNFKAIYESIKVKKNKRSEYESKE